MLKIEHLGIAVKELTTAIPLFEQLLNTPCYKTEELDYINKQLSTIDTVYKKSGSAEPLPVAQSKPSDNSAASEQADNSLIEFSYTLYKRKQELMRKQRMPQNLLIIDDAIVSVQKKRSTLIMIAAGGVIGFIFYALIAGIILPAIRFRER